MQEVRVGYLLEEEFSCDRAFVDRFLQECRPDLALIALESVVHSANDRFGEADLIVLLQASSRNDEVVRRVALLIEDKITTGFQPRQAERYIERGQAGIRDGMWEEFITILVAPQTYIARSCPFQFAVSLEAVGKWLAERDPLRLAFKRAILDRAIAKKAVSGVQNVDPIMTAFRKAHYAYLSVFNELHGTDFRISAPRDTYWDDNWFEMRSARLPAGCDIRHLSRFGKVQIRFKNASASDVEPILRHFIENDLDVVFGGRHKQHLAIQVLVRPINDYASFEAQRDRVEEALLAAQRICKLVEANRAQIEAVFRTRSYSPSDPKS